MDCKIFLIFLTIISFCVNASSGVELAESEFNNKNFIEAVDIYKELLISETDNEKVSDYLRKIGHCYYNMRFYDKALFYYEKVLENSEDIEVLNNLYNILVQKGDFIRAEETAARFPDGPGKDRLLYNIYEKTSDNEKFFETCYRLYKFSGEPDYLRKMIELFPEKTRSLLAGKFDSFLFQYYTDKESSYEKIIGELEKDLTSTDKIRLVLFLEKENRPEAVYIAQRLYRENNESSNDFDRYIRILYGNGRIPELKKEIDYRRRKLSPSLFLEQHYSLLMSLSLNDEIVETIKSVKDYWKDRNNIYKLVDVYRNAMGYSYLFDELENAVEKGSIKIYEAENVISGLFRNNQKWASEFMKSGLFIKSSTLLRLKAYHYSQDIDKAVHYLYKEPQLIKMFVNSVNAHSVYAERLDPGKIDYSDVSDFISYFPLSSLEMFFEKTENPDFRTDILINILNRKKISVEEFEERFIKGTLVSGFIGKMSDMLGIERFSGIEFYKLLFRRLFKLENNVRFSIQDKNEQSLKILALVMAGENQIEIALGIYDNLFLKKDFLYSCLEVITGKKTGSDLANGNKWYELELARLSYEKDNIMKNVLELFFRKENWYER